MSPSMMASLVYRREPCARTFETDLFLHLAYGYVFSTPEAFVMGRPVRRDANINEIKNPAVEFNNPDAWWIYLASGNYLDLLFRFEPFPLPWYGWERQNVPRWYPRETVLKYANKLSPPNAGLPVP